MLPVLASALLLLLAASTASAFYLPGVAPRDYAKGDAIGVKVIKYVSSHTEASGRTLVDPAEQMLIPRLCCCLDVVRLDSIKTQLPYDYYSLPFCRPPAVEESAENLGEVLSGDRIENSMYKVRRLSEADHRRFCRLATILAHLLSL